VFLDPSHSTGYWEYVDSIALAGIAAGADGLMIEVHPHPQRARSDGMQSLKPERFAQLVKKIEALCSVLGRTLAEKEGSTPQPTPPSEVQT
jgi:3-deoxy-7-phosphoheptulonate synthase